ncbi:MAG: SpoIIE family protein phosphatase [Spirochaetia bacterium]|nr:SpoIIE family protein phosphatase [Spirochaetota bacterium]MDW8112145.1 SpoIIE family protein phosphatase [Spirochaetia bacterium]
MSESLIPYSAFITLQILGWFIFLKSPKLINTRIIFITIMSSSLITLFIGISWDSAKMNALEITNASLRLTSLMMVIANLSILRLMVSFPEEKDLKLLDLLLLGAVGIVVYILFMTDSVIVGAEQREGIIYRLEGQYYRLYTSVATGLLVVSSLIGIVKAVRTKHKIFKLQTTLIVIGTALSLLLAVFIAMVIPILLKTFRYYYLSSLLGFVLAGSLAYAITRTKLFNITSAIYNTIVVVVSIIVLGAIGGITLKVISNYSTSLANVFPLSIFLLLSILILIGNYLNKFIRKILKFKSNYIETLLNDINSIDLTKPQEEIVDKLVKSLRENISSTKINLFVENEVGLLENIYTETNTEESLDKNLKVIEILSSYGNKTVFLSSEIISDPILKTNADVIQDMFKKLSSEVIILVKDGTQTIMLLSLGEKENGRTYDNYDYKALQTIYPTLFTIAYILKNLKKQKITITVNREIEMSRTITETILHNIKKPNPAELDFEYITRTSSGLGGDFVDVIKIKNRYLIVIGDISGKGLTASMSMVVLKSSIYTLIRNKLNFKGMVEELNKIIKENLPKGTFFSGVFILVDTQQKEMFFINAGIPAMWHYSSKLKSISQIQGEGKVLGFVKDISKYIQINKVSLNKNDIVVIATDGYTGAKSLEGTTFPLSITENIIKLSENKNSREILDKLFDTWYNFVNRKIEDDISLVVFKLS